MGSPLRLLDGRRSPESGYRLLSTLDRPRIDLGLDLLLRLPAGEISPGAGGSLAGNCTGGLGIPIT